MKILFITGAYPKGSEKELLELGKGTPLSIPSNTFQWAVINGLEDNGADYQVVSYPFLSCFPFHFKRLFSPQKDFVVAGKLVGSMEPFLNVSYFAECSIERRLYKYVDNWVSSNQEEERLTVLVYSPDARFIHPLGKLKRKYKHLSVCSIVTDLPDDYNNPIYNLSVYRRFVNSIKEQQDKQSYKEIDKFVLLSKPMEEKIPESVGRNIIIEGISSDCNGLHFKTKDSEIKTLLYTGSLGIHTSINDLVDAFMKTLNPHYKLVICGGGDCESHIKECANKDKRIEFRGIVPRHIVLDLQRSATAVINPRKPSIPITRYSFPSKTMEYMSSGTPLIGYKLGGIPEEYYEHYYVISDESEEALIKTINDILTKPLSELNAKAEDAYRFISENKTSKHQVSKLIDFLKQ